MITSDSIRRIKRIWRVAALVLALLAGLQGGGAAHAQNAGAFLPDAVELPQPECGEAQELNSVGVPQQFEWREQCYTQETPANSGLTRTAYIRIDIRETGNYSIVADAPRDGTFIAVFSSNGRHEFSSSPLHEESIMYSQSQSSIHGAFLMTDTYWIQVFAEEDPPNNETFMLTVKRIVRPPDPPPPPDEPMPDPGCRVHELDLNVEDSGTWRNSCQGIDLAPPIAMGESCYTSTQTYRFSRYYRLDIVEDASLQVAYDGADCARVLIGNESSPNRGKELGRGDGEGSITEFALVGNSFNRMPLEKLPEGRYFIELAASSQGYFALRVCEASQSCRLTPPPPPAAPAPPPMPEPSAVPPGTLEPEQGVPILQVIIGAGVVALIILLVWILLSRSRKRHGGVQ